MKYPKSALLCAALLLTVAGCGESEKEPEKNENAERARTYCTDLRAMVEGLRQKRGTCAPHFNNEEPLAFRSDECEAALEANACADADFPFVRRYIDCLNAVQSCNPSQQTVFNEAIDECVDQLQEEPQFELNGDESCRTIVIGD